jgi:acetyl-CoA acyltransferase
MIRMMVNDARSCMEGIQVARIAVVSGLRTPFLKMGGAYTGMPSRMLGATVVAELVQRTGLRPSDIEQVVYGQVISSPEAPNIAREVVMGSGLPAEVDAYSVSRACATGYQATVSLAQNISAGNISVGIAGGADSATEVPFTAHPTLAKALVRVSSARTIGEKLAAFRQIRPRHLVPASPALREPSSDYTMGEAAEKMAKENGITRERQDEFAHRSHLKAASAWEQGLFDKHVMPVFPAPGFQPVVRDNLVRADSELERYGSLRPVFDRQHGSVTAGNSSPLTDGASAIVLMSEERALADGFQPLGFIKSYAFSALDPNWQMLMGPSFATPVALDRAGLELTDIDLVDMHEAFAAQVLSNVDAFSSSRFARAHLGRDRAIGELDPDKFNVSGSSISLGHPFAATGARQIMQLLHDLKRTGGQFGLCTACAAGGLGAAMVLEAAP